MLIIDVNKMHSYPEIKRNAAVRAALNLAFICICLCSCVYVCDPIEPEVENVSPRPEQNNSFRRMPDEMDRTELLLSKPNMKIIEDSHYFEFVDTMTGTGGTSDPFPERLMDFE